MLFLPFPAPCCTARAFAILLLRHRSLRLKIQQNIFPSAYAGTHPKAPLFLFSFSTIDKLHPNKKRASKSKISPFYQLSKIMLPEKPRQATRHKYRANILVVTVFVFARCPIIQYYPTLPFIPLHFFSPNGFT